MLPAGAGYAAITFGALSQQQTADPYWSELEARYRYALTANILYAVAGAALITAVILFFVLM